MKKSFILLVMAFATYLNAVCQYHGKALQLNGITDYVTIGNMGTMPLQGSITFWMRPTSFDNYRNVLTTGGLDDCSGGNNAVRFELGEQAGQFAVGIGETGNCGTSGGEYTTSMTAGSEYHIVLTWDQATNNIKGYLDGSLVFDQVHTLWNATFNDVKIGVGWDITRKWQGSVDEVTFWNKALTAAEVINTRNDNFSRSDANLIAYYSFDSNNTNGENQVVPNDRNPGTYNGITVGTASTPVFTASVGGVFYHDADGDGYGNLNNRLFVVDATPPDGYVSDSTDCNDDPATGGANIHPGATEICNNGIDDNCDGIVDSTYLPPGLKLYMPFSGNANDASGRGHNGTVFNASLTTDRFGKANSAYSFNGANTRIEIPDNADFNPADITISAWVNITGSTGEQFQSFISKALGTGQLNSFVPAYDFYNGQIGSYLCNEESCVTVFSPLSVNAGWFHYAITFNDAADQLKLYINGVLANTVSTSHNLFYDNSPLTIGCEYNNNTPALFTNGKIDEVMIFNRALTAGEVAHLLTSGVSPEICNGIDDNCNGLIDEGLGTTWYADADNDGYGNFAHDTTACIQPIGFVSDNTDCNDDPARGGDSVHPGAKELAGNHIDDNCNGLIDESCTANPSVSLTAPVNNATYPAGVTIQIKATAVAASGTISKVEFYDGTTLLNTAINVPYTYNWANVPAGNYILTAKTTDNCGLSATSDQVHIIVATNQSPVVTLTSPARDTNIVVPGPLLLSAAASDPDGTIRSVAFYNGSSLIFSKNKAPYNIVFYPVPTGSYHITAVATDNTGHKSTSAMVHVTVVHNRPPVVSITSPSDGSTYGAPASILLSADAVAHGSRIKTVKFYDGTKLIHTEENIPYSWNWKNVAAGTYTITAKATDTYGRVTISDPVIIKIDSMAIANCQGRALQFDGIDDYVNVGVRPNLEMTSALTIEAWIYPKGVGSATFEGGVIVNREGEYEIARFADGTIRFALANSFPGWNWINTGYVAPLNVWTHVSLTYSASDGIVNVYGNGVKKYSSLASGDIVDIGISSDSDQLWIGGRQFENGPGIHHSNFNGAIDEVRIWNESIPQPEIQQWMKKSVTSAHPHFENLAGYWKFDEETGNQTTDASGNGNTGKLTNSPTHINSTAPVNWLTFYADKDGDRFGDARNVTEACSAPAGFIADNTDCNDIDPTVHPGAPELCNGRDDNCNGQVDEGCTSPREAVTSAGSLKNRSAVNNKRTLSDEISLRLLPNPAHSILNVYTIGLQKNKRSTISIISSSGAILQTKQVNNQIATGSIQLNVSSLSSGLYIIRIVSSDNVVNKSFVKL